LKFEAHSAQSLLTFGKDYQEVHLYSEDINQESMDLRRTFYMFFVKK
jgi:hypothetical protein